MLLEIIIAFLGLILGLIIAKLTVEELEPGKKYFIWFKKIILITLIIALLYLALPNYLIYSIFFILGLIVSYFFRKEYFYFGLALANSNLLLIPILIFLFGLPHGSLLFAKKYKYKTLLLDLILFLVPLFTLFIKNLTLNNYILAFTAGAFFTLIFKK